MSKSLKILLAILLLSRAQAEQAASPLQFLWPIQIVDKQRPPTSHTTEGWAEIHLSTKLVTTAVRSLITGNSTGDLIRINRWTSPFFIYHGMIEFIEGWIHVIYGFLFDVVKGKVPPIAWTYFKATLKGKVVDPHGAPLSNWPIRIHVDHDDDNGRGIHNKMQAWLKTDAQGFFNLQLEDTFVEKHGVTEISFFASKSNPQTQSSHLILSLTPDGQIDSPDLILSKKQSGLWVVTVDPSSRT
jgi:hypothetical protein